MGFSIKLINKVYVFLRPRTIDQAILLMTEIDGIYQHNFYYSHKGNKCFICGYEEIGAFFLVYEVYPMFFAEWRVIVEDRKLCCTHLQLLPFDER